MKILAALAAVLSFSVSAGTLVEFGSINKDSLELKVVKASYEFESGVELGLYGAAGKEDVFTQDFPPVGSPANIDKQIRLAGISAGYVWHFVQTEVWDFSLKPQVIYEQSFYKEKTYIYDGVVDGEHSYSRSDETSSEGKTIGAITLSTSLKRLTVSASYDSENRTTITVGLKL